MSFWDKLKPKKETVGDSANQILLGIEAEAGKLQTRMEELQRRIDSGETPEVLQENLDRMKREMQGLEDKRTLLQAKKSHEENKEDVAA